MVRRILVSLSVRMLVRRWKDCIVDEALSCVRGSGQLVVHQKNYQTVHRMVHRHDVCVVVVRLVAALGGHISSTS
jgi:hypothetical protein